ncbi:MAG: hypothetical protein WC972_11935 [Trueperaceae bacterium]
MPQGQSGLSALTAPNMLLDAGAVYLNIGIPELEDASSSTPLLDAVSVSGCVKLGGTRGGNSFNPGRVIRQMPVDGGIGPIKGFNRRQTSAPTLTVNMLELTPDNLANAIAAARAATVGQFTKITGGAVRDSDYIGNVALVTTIKGNTSLPFVVVIHNAMALESPEFTTADEDEVVLPVTFNGHVLVTAPNDEAWAIYHPGLDVSP